MTRMRWIAVMALMLALVIRVSHRYVSFGLAYAVAPGVHRGISISEPLFWVLLVLERSCWLLVFLALIT